MYQKTRFHIFKRDNFRCQYCGRSSDDVQLEVDHIIPVSKGGSNDVDNLITSCRECNRGKSNHEVIQTPEEPKIDEYDKIVLESHEVMDKIIDLEEQLQKLYSTDRELMVKRLMYEIKDVDYKIKITTEETLKENPEYKGISLEQFKVAQYKFIGFLEGRIIEEEGKTEQIIKLKLDDLPSDLGLK
jgi:predicted restriction endonuclease